MEFGSIRTVPIRDIWPGEATDFTPWLSQNLDRIADKLGMELTLEGTESSAGDFSADIVARDLSTNRLVVIENQFGSTDHRHLGQILTYASVLGAQAVVWIAESIRAEHKATINFLNQNLKESLQLYAIEVSIIRIDDSRPAYAFNLVCMPAEADNQIKTQEASELKQKYRAFFQALIDDLRTQHQFTNARLGQPQGWYTFSSENSRVFVYSASFAQGGRVRAEVYIDCHNKARNEAIFDLLYAQKERIETAYGAELSWERLDNKRACRVAIYRDGDIDATSETLDDIKRWTIDQLLKFKWVFPPMILSAYTDTESTAG